MREPSASQLPLAQVCAHPWTSGTPWPEDTSTTGLLGTRTHRGCEALVTGEHVFPEVLAGLTESEVRELCGCVERAREYLAETERPGEQREAELWLRYQVQTGAVQRGSRHDRRKPPGTWTAILDYLAIDGAGRGRVIDWKTGRQEYTTDVRANPQIRLQARAAAAMYGLSEVRVELVYLGRNEVDVDAAEYGPLELGLIGEELRQLRRTLTRGPTPPVPGPHCTQHYCRLRGVCPATRAALASAYPLEDVLAVTPRDEAHARWILERLPGARAALDAVQAGVDEYARTHLVELADGYRYGWREHERRTVIVDTPEQRAALVEVLGTAPVKVRHSSSIEDIEDAARALLAAQGLKRGIKDLTNQALAALERVGGVRTSKYVTAESFKPKRGSV